MARACSQHLFSISALGTPGRVHREKRDGKIGGSLGHWSEKQPYARTYAYDTDMTQGMDVMTKSKDLT